MDNLQYGLMNTAAPKGTLFEFAGPGDDITIETGLRGDIMAAFNFLRHELTHVSDIPRQIADQMKGAWNSVPNPYETSKRMISNVYNDPIDTGLLGFAALSAAEDEKVARAASALLTGLSRDFKHLTQLKLTNIHFYWDIMHLLAAIARSPKLAGIFAISVNRALRNLVQQETTPIV